MKTYKTIAIMLATLSLTAAAVYRIIEEDYNDFESHRDDFNDSQESLEEVEEVEETLDSLNIEPGHIDYYKHHSDMYEEPTRAQYDFTYEIRDLKAGKTKKQQARSKTTKRSKGSLQHKIHQTTERIVHNPAYNKETKENNIEAHIRRIWQCY